MKAVWKILLTLFVATSVFADPGPDDHEHDYQNFEYVDAGRVFVPNKLEGTILAWDKETNEFVWKNFADENGTWKAISKADIDQYLREIKSEDDFIKYMNYDGAYVKVRQVGDDIALSYELRMNGGGPVAAVVCGTVCKIVQSCGCGAGSWIVGGLNPGLGVLYYGVCELLSTGGTAGCVAACLTLPTP